MPRSKIEIIAGNFGLLLLLCFAFLKFFRPVEISDIWWHLATGRWIFQHQQFPQVDIFSPLKHPSPFILNQAFGSCVYYAIYLLGGFSGLKIFRVVLFAGILVLLYKRVHKNLSSPVLLLLMTTLTVLLSYRSHLRPYIFNFVFIPFYLNVLFEHQRSARAKRIFFLPLLSVLWGNIHLGCFFYGTIMIGLFFLSHVVDYIKLETEKPTRAPDLDGQRVKIKDITLVLLGHAAALMINPFGWKGFVYPFHAFLNQDFYINRHLSVYIAELLPPSYLLTWDGLWVFLLITLTGLALLRIKSHKMTHVLLFAISLLLFLHSARGIGFFALCCATIIAEERRSRQLSGNAPPSRVRKFAENLLLTGLILFLLCNILHLFNQKIYQNGRVSRNAAETLDPMTPVRIVDLLHKYDVQGNIINWDSLGGYILWRSYPQIRTIADSRQADARILVDYINTLKDPEHYWDKTEAKYHLTAAILTPSFPVQQQLFAYLLTRPDWNLITVHGPFVLMVKNNTGSFPLSMRNYAQVLSDAGAVDLHELTAALSARKQSVAGAISRFVKGELIYNQDLEEAVLLLSYGFRNAGLRKLIEVNNKVDDLNARNFAIAVLRTLSKKHR